MTIYGVFRFQEDDWENPGDYLDYFTTRELAEEAVKALKYNAHHWNYSIHKIEALNSLADPNINSYIKTANECYQDYLKFGLGANNEN